MNLTTMSTTDGNYPDSNSIVKASLQDPTEELFQEDIKNEGHSRRGTQNHTLVHNNAWNLETHNKSILDTESHIKQKMALTAAKKSVQSIPADQISSPEVQPLTGNDPAISKIIKVDQIHLNMNQIRRKTTNKPTAKVRPQTT